MRLKKTDFCRFWRFLSVFLLIFAIFSPLGEAARRDGAKSEKVVRRNVVFYKSSWVYEDDMAICRIEIGLNKPGATFTVRESSSNPKNLVVELPNVKGNTNIVNDETLEGKFARYLSVREETKKENKKKIKQLKITVAMTHDVKDNFYRVYTLRADQKSGKPDRIVIDVSNSVFPVKYPVVEGVSGKTIVIDPGHGGSDVGARGIGGLLEKDVNLAVSLKLRNILEASGANCVMTRDEDNDVFTGRVRNTGEDQELRARVDVGKRTRDTDIFVSVHSNAFYNEEANGSQTFYFHKTPKDELLAQKIQSAIIDSCKRRDRGVKAERFFVLRHTKVPAALVEMAFITNGEEGILLGDEDFHEKMALGIATGIGQYFSEI